MVNSLIDLGYFGLFIGAMLSATIIPFSSDLLFGAMLFAGGDIITTVIVATLGNWAGGMISYFMGYFGKWEWIEKWLKVKRETLEKQKEKVGKYGAWLAFWSWLPFVGDLFAIALGFYKVSPKLSALFMLLGKGLRFALWATLFYYGFFKN